MISYNELYEYLRKEKYGEQLQALPKDFVERFSEYIRETKKQFSVTQDDVFGDDFLRKKKQFENALSIFRELMLKRKKKILNLVFVASETGVMKKDFADMLIFERELFEELVGAMDLGDKKLNSLLNGSEKKNEKNGNTMVIIEDDIDQVVDMEGKIIGPFKAGGLVNVNSQIAGILVSDGKAKFVDVGT